MIRDAARAAARRSSTSAISSTRCSTLADTVTVLRNGRLVRTAPAARGDRGEPGRRRCSAPRPRRSTSRSRERAGTAPVVLDASRAAPQGRAQRHLACDPRGRDRRPRRARRQRPHRAGPRDRGRRSDRRRDDRRRRQGVAGSARPRTRSTPAWRSCPRAARRTGCSWSSPSRRTRPSRIWRRSRRAASCGRCAERSKTRALLQTLAVEPPSPAARAEQPLGRQPAEGAVRPLAASASRGC